VVRDNSLEQHLAHFHRVLAELLVELADVPGGPIWLGEDTHHDIRGSYEHNTYARALYRVFGLEPYQERVNELNELQRHVVQAFGLKRVPRTLLTPVVIEDVTHVRLHNLTYFSSSCKNKGFVLERIRAAIATTRRNYRVFAQQGGIDDPASQRVAAELEGYQRVLAEVETSPELHYRVRVQQSRVRPYVYLQHDQPVQIDSRLHGVILVGPQIKLTPVMELRRGRSDKRTLAPLFHYGATYIYPERQWQEAKP